VRLATAYLGHAPAGAIRAGWLALRPESWTAGHRVTECTLGQYDGNNALVVLNVPLRAG
jgi:hypothetical protein